MAPNSRVLEAGLVAAVRGMFKEGNEQISVNAARKRAEEDLDLEPDFFVSDAWKAKSKSTIKEAMNSVLNEAEEAEPELATSSGKSGAKARGPKKGLKRESSEANGTPAKKRQKKQIISPPPKETVEGDESTSELTDLSDIEDAKPKKEANKRSIIAKGKPKHAGSSAEDSGDSEGAASGEDTGKNSRSGAPPKSKAKAAKQAAKRAAPKKKAKSPEISDDEPETNHEKNDKEPGESKAANSDSEDSPLSEVREDFSEDEEKKKPATVDYNSDSSMSIVYDEPPKRKKGKQKAADSKPKKAAKATSSKKPSASEAAVLPDEAEIKKLQGQLVKCGVRKIWGIELKQHGDDAKAKIRHLKGMLRDIGMTGRFSEARAREIKEMRELAADLEAVQEMDKSWGVGGRASRSRAAASRSNKTLEDDNKEGDGGKYDDKEKDAASDEDEEDVKTFSKGRGSAKYHSDLAFLGDESESE